VSPFPQRGRWPLWSNGVTSQFHRRRLRLTPRQFSMRHPTQHPCGLTTLTFPKTLTLWRGGRVRNGTRVRTAGCGPDRGSWGHANARVLLVALQTSRNGVLRVLPRDQTPIGGVLPRRYHTAAHRTQVYASPIDAVPTSASPELVRGCCCAALRGGRQFPREFAGWCEVTDLQKRGFHETSVGTANRPMGTAPT
jgi:hypothetical protein